MSRSFDIKYTIMPNIDVMAGIKNTGENKIMHSAKKRAAVTRGAAIRFVTGEIKLSAPKLYAKTGRVNTVAATVTITGDKIIFKILLFIF